MIGSLCRPSFFLCFTGRNLCPFTKRPPRGISRIKVQFGSGFKSVASEEKDVQQISKLLTGLNDEHGGVIVEMTTDPMDAALFVPLLRASVAHWQQQGKKGVWIKLPVELVNLVEPAVKEGFYFHHAEPKYLMLVNWIPKTTNTIPANASHRVGIGAFVMNEKKEVLVVQEKSGRFRGMGVWKFPTGVVDAGEDICDAAVREVKEETGVSNKCSILIYSLAIDCIWILMCLIIVLVTCWILLLQIDTKFVEILAFRQSHKSFFEKSDLFFACLLQPLSFHIQKQEAEIEAAQQHECDLNHC
ncbi:nudix hydrolase 2 isoform X3 [Diospyros lotus]|uniref:nudix hydrolase 2 isoform X3 n=1 Tax=Diospyros lotus TaxID=55363 RepID=UPI00224F0AD4|nr:nudix hydrolase 2 isoform X3 [Diospyros lotus]